MVRLTINLGISLMILGIAAYFFSGAVSVTALIPAFFGLPLFLLGLLARNEKWHRHAMHGAIIVALLGFLGSMMGVPKLFILVQGGEVARPMAAIIQSIMSFLCAIFIIFGIKLFVDARKAKASE
jgi:hypothetical protein